MLLLLGIKGSGQSQYLFNITMVLKIKNKLINFNIIKYVINKKNIKSNILVYFYGFQKDFNSYLNHLNILDINTKCFSKSLLENQTNFNGIVLSSQYLENLFKSNKFNNNNLDLELLLDKKILQSKILKEIPLLYSKIIYLNFNNIYQKNLENKEKELFSYFDNVYVYETKRKFLNSDPILLEYSDRNSLYLAKKHPIGLFKEKVFKTKPIKLIITE